MDTLDLPTGTRISLVIAALYKQPPSEAYAELPEATWIVARFPHPDNAFAPILVVLAGIEIADNAEQLANALSPILLTPDGMDIDDKLEQPLNAPLPMLPTPGEIATLVSARQLLNVEAGIEDKDACKLTELSPVQPENTPAPIFVTLLGTDTFDKLAQLANALSAILLTLPGILTLVIAFPAKAPAPIDVTSEGIVTAPPPPVYAVSTPLLIVIFSAFAANTSTLGSSHAVSAHAAKNAIPFFIFERIISVTPSSQRGTACRPQYNYYMWTRSAIRLHTKCQLSGQIRSAAVY